MATCHLPTSHASSSPHSDASVTIRLAAIAVARRNKEGAVVVLQESIGWASTCNVLTTEIVAIAAALDYAQESFEQEPPKSSFEAPRLRVTTLSDSQHALEVIRAGNSVRTGRALLRKIAESFYALEERGRPNAPAVPTMRLSVTSSAYARYGLYSGRYYRLSPAIGGVMYLTY